MLTDVKSSATLFPPTLLLLATAAVYVFGRNRMRTTSDGFVIQGTAFQILRATFAVCNYRSAHTPAASRPTRQR